MSEIVIKVADVDITAAVLFADAKFITSASGTPGTFRFRVKDTAMGYAFVTGSEVTVDVDSERVFWGYLQAIGRQFFFPVDKTGPGIVAPRVLVLEGADGNILFRKRVAFDQDHPNNIELRSYPAGTADTTIIDDLVSEFLDLTGDGIDVSSLVEGVGDSNPDLAGNVASAGNYWGDAMNAIAFLTGAIWYLDPDKKLVYTDVDTPNSDYYLTDTPTFLDGGTIIWHDTGLITAVWAAETFFVGGAIINVDDHIWQSVGIDGETSAVMPDFDPEVGFYEDGGVIWQLYVFWQPLTFYGVGQIIQPTTPNGHLYEAETPYETGGVSGAEEPIFPTDGGTVQEGSPPAFETDPFAVGYRDVEILEDGANLINDAMVWGAGQGSKRIHFFRSTDEDSIEDHGLWQYGELRTDLYRDVSIQHRAESFVYGSEINRRGHKDPAPSVMLTVFRPLFRVAQKVSFESQVHGWSDVIPIRRIEITFPTPSAVKYRMTLSHFTDQPWNTSEFWFPPLKNPPPWSPPGLPPIPGPPTLEGITDSFNREDQNLAGSTADCGLVWSSTASGKGTVDNDLYRQNPGGDNANWIDTLEGEIPVFPVHGIYDFVQMGSGVHGGQVTMNDGILVEWGYSTIAYDASILGDGNNLFVRISDGVNEKLTRISVGDLVLPQVIEILIDADTANVITSFGTATADRTAATPGPIAAMTGGEDWAFTFNTSGGGVARIDNLDIDGLPGTNPLTIPDSGGVGERIKVEADKRTLILSYSFLPRSARVFVDGLLMAPSVYVEHPLDGTIVFYADIIPQFVTVNYFAMGPH